jgi:hypothetical protein
MDHVNRLLIMVALVLCVLMVLVLHSPISNGITFAVNTVDSALPGHANSPVALAPSRPSTATPSPTQGNANGNGNGNVKKPTPTPVPSFPVLPTLPPIFPTPGPTISPTPTPSAGPTPGSAPMASFGYNPARPMVGQAVSFDGTASRCGAGPCAYKWSDDACPSPCGDLGTGPMLAFTFADVGTKFVRLTLTDALGRSGTVEHNVAVAAPGPGPTPTPTPGPTPTPTPGPTPTPTPGPTPTPAPTPTPPPGPGSLLTWRPPVCGGGGYTCVTLNLANTGRHQNLWLDSTKDWTINLPKTPLVGGLDIDGGHNVIIIGGEIDLPVPCDADNAPCHGFNLVSSPNNRPNGGEMYIEGVLIKNPSTANDRVSGDGIVLQQTYPGGWARVTIENVRVEGLQGCDVGPHSGAHADVFQPYAPSGAALRIDHLTGTTSYQGMQVAPDGYFTPAIRNPSSVDFRNVNINIIPNVVTGCAGNSDRYAWWIAGGVTGCEAPPTNLVNDYAQEPDGSLLYNSVAPDLGWGNGCDPLYVAGLATWPTIAAITGGIRSGLPAGGDFVPVGRAGVNYVTPGYR